MDPDRLHERYRELQSYVGWTDEDARRIEAVAPLLDPHLAALIDDFYAQIERHPEAHKVITGGGPQIDRLKGTLLRWVRELLAGLYDDAYVDRRWRVGWRHVEIGLKQAYTNAALSRLRAGLILAMQATWRGGPDGLTATARSLNTLLDLDLAIIEEAYQAAYASRLQRAEERRTALVKGRSEATFRLLVEAAQCMIVILRPDHSIVYFTPFAERLTGYSSTEVCGRDYLRLFLPEDDRREVADEFARVLAGGPTSGSEKPVVCRDGSCRWLAWNARPLEDYDGGPALLMVGQDITYLKRDQTRALQAERLAAIGQMVAGLAHESRNALQRAQACLEMLALTVKDRPEALDLVARIQNAQDHLHHLYEDVRSYAAPITLERRPCNLGDVWRGAWAQLDDARREKGAILRERLADVDLRCAADPFRLGQVFDNVLVNALAAGPSPVEIEIHAEESDVDERPALQVSVRDNGPGLDPEQRQRVFEPFYTTKARGTGLGMAIARRIVEAHGGRITLGEARISGAEFVITLPRDYS